MRIIHEIYKRHRNWEVGWLEVEKPNHPSLWLAVFMAWGDSLADKDLNRSSLGSSNPFQNTEQYRLRSFFVYELRVVCKTQSLPPGFPKHCRDEPQSHASLGGGEWMWDPANFLEIEPECDHFVLVLRFEAV